MITENFSIYYGALHWATWLRTVCLSCAQVHKIAESSNFMKKFFMVVETFDQQEVKVIWQKAPHGGPIPRLGVTPGGRNLYH